MTWGHLVGLILGWEDCFFTQTWRFLMWRHDVDLPLSALGFRNAGSRICCVTRCPWFSALVSVTRWSPFTLLSEPARFGSSDGGLQCNVPTVAFAYTAGSWSANTYLICLAIEILLAAHRHATGGKTSRSIHSEPRRLTLTWPEQLQGEQRWLPAIDNE